MSKVLLVDIGNSNIVIGVCDGQNITETYRIPTRRDYSKKELLQYLNETLSLSEGYDGCILSSVVPEITDVMSNVLTDICNTAPIIAALSLNTGIDTSEYDTSCLGIDRIVDLIAASSIYGTPVMVCDLGTCTTISVLDSNKKLLGGIICAGIQLSLDAQAARASQLPQLTASANTNLLGKDTASNMLSGAVSATGIMISALADQISANYNLDDLKIVITGGLSPLVIPWINKPVCYDPDLLMKGLYRLYSINSYITRYC